MPETFIWHHQLQLFHSFVLFLDRYFQNCVGFGGKLGCLLGAPESVAAGFQKWGLEILCRIFWLHPGTNLSENVLKERFSLNIPVFSFRWTNQFWLHCFSSSASFLFCFRFFVCRSDILVRVRSLAHVASSLSFLVRMWFHFFPLSTLWLNVPRGWQQGSVHRCPCSPACESFPPEQISVEFPECDNNTQDTLLPVTGRFILLFFADWKYFICTCVLKL
jgi:hypothetical protein